MKYRNLSTLLCVLAISATAVAQEDATPAEATATESERPLVALDGVAAVVNDGIVLQSELGEEIRNIAARLQASGTPLPPDDVLAVQVLERLVIQQIQLQRAARTGIVVSDEELNGAMAGIAQRNNISLTELPDNLAKEGIDYGTFRESVRTQITVDRLRQRDVLSRIAVSPREIDNYIERQQGSDNNEYNVSHILIAVPSGATPEQIAEGEDKVQDIYQRAINGEDFAELAVANSDSRQALEGGLIGWRKGGELPTLFAEVVPGMQVGQVSEPIRGGSGFHLIRLNDSRGREAVMEDQIHIRHILIKTTEIKDDDTARQQLVQLRKQIVEDEADFATIATAVSEDPGSAAKGGDLGWTGPGVFVPEFTTLAATLEVGELSEPFASPFGWHILEVMGRRTYDTTDDIQRREAIMAIQNAKLEEETELWIRRIRDEAFVEYRL